MKTSVQEWVRLGLLAGIGTLAVSASLTVMDLMFVEKSMAQVAPEVLAEARLLRQLEHELVSGLRLFEDQRPPEGDTRSLGFKRNSQTLLRAQTNQIRQRLLNARLHDSVAPQMLLSADRLVALSKDPYNAAARKRAEEAVRQSLRLAERRIRTLGVSGSVQIPAAVTRDF